MFMNAGIRPFWAKALNTLAIIFLVFFLLVQTGLFFPKILFIGEFGTLMETFLSLDLLLISLAITLISFWNFHRNSRPFKLVILCLNAVVTIAFLIPVIILVEFAHKYNTDISWSGWMKVQFEMGKPDLSKTAKYGQAEGKDLLMDFSFPITPKPAGKLRPLIFIHGGGFVAGARNQEPGWVKFYNKQGFVVFDVDYRLATKNHPSWNKAAPDIVTAIQYIGDHANDYNVDMKKLVIAGSSAGAALALQVGYGLANSAVSTNKDGLVYRPKLVLALYPAGDITALWNVNSSFFSMTSRALCQTYTGGTPLTTPQAYRATSIPPNLTNKGGPPTLIVSGREDHLIPYNLQKSVSDDLSKYGIVNQLVAIPFNDHFFTVGTGSIGNQIALKIVADFLKRYQ
jgi:acetyl esterase